MAERAVVWVDGVQVPGRDLRLAAAATLTQSGSLTARDGVLSGLEVSATSPATRAVNVAAGQCAVVVSETAPGGVALCANDATVTVPIAAADPTNPRIDLVVARVFAELTAAGSRRWALEMVQGTPAASPVAPALPANALLLRAVTVPANASAITAAEVGTVLPARTVAVGGITPSRDAADVVGVVAGQYRHRLDVDRLERWDGAAWAPAAGRVQEVWSGTASTGSAVASFAYPFSRDSTKQVGATGRVTTPSTGELRVTNPTDMDEAWRVHALTSMPVQNAGRGFVDLRIGTAVIARTPSGGEDVVSVSAPLRVPANSAVSFNVFFFQSTGAAQNVTVTVTLTR